MCLTNNINDNTIIKIKYDGINEMTPIPRYSHIVAVHRVLSFPARRPHRTYHTRPDGISTKPQSMCVYYSTALRECYFRVQANIDRFEN